MDLDRPTASVTGQQDWEWNRRRAASDPSHQVTSGGDKPQGGRQPPDRQRWDPPRPDLRRGRPGNGPPDYREARLQAIITRYERLLDEKHRLIDEQSQGDRDGRPTVLTAVRRWLADR